MGKVDKIVNSIPCCMLFASSKLQKATIPAVLSRSMLNANLQLKQKASITVSPSLPVRSAIITDQPHYRFTESSINTTS